MGGIVVMQEDGNLAPVDGATLAKLIKRGHINAKPPLTNEEIMDRSKDDAFSKIVAIGQILYFSIDFLARMIQSTPTSQLELGVASIALYSVISYILAWYKPKGIETPTVIEARQPFEDEALARISDTNLSPSVFALTRNGTLLMREIDPVSYFRLFRNGRPDDGDELSWLALCSIILLSIPPGAIHIAGWNFPFPTVADTWLWRSSSIAATAAVPAFFALFWVDPLLHYVRGALWSCLIEVQLHIMFIVMSSYFVARVILVVLMIRLLFYLPPEAFHATSWSMSIPHIG